MLLSLCFVRLAGDFLLVGIDRRNDPEMVAAAYNDNQGGCVLT